jgi:hypothetical protein
MVAAQRIPGDIPAMMELWTLTSPASLLTAARSRR